MKVSLKVDDLSFKRVQVGLHNIANLVPENARKTMRRAAERIVKNAKIYVPEETGALRDSIRLESSYGVRGRLQINVIAGGEEPISVKGRIITLDQYAAIIHERYEEMEPGPRTKAKRLENPGAHVGEKFLSRAADEEEKKIARDMIAAITRTIKSEGL